MDEHVLAGYRKIFDYTPVAFAILQLVRQPGGDIQDFKVLYLNEACGKLLQQAPEKVAGHEFLATFPDAPASLLHLVRWAAADGEKSVRRVYNAKLARYIHIECYPLEPDICCSIQLDVTEEIRRRQELEEFKESYDAVIASSGLRYWEYDLRHDRAIQSEASQRELGIPKYMENYPQSWLDTNILLPEYWADYLEVHKKLKNGLKTVTFEAEIWPPDAETPQWEKVIYCTIFDALGEPLKAIGTAIDITEQKNLEAAFRDFQQDQRLLAASRLDAYKVNVTNDTILSIKQGSIVLDDAKQRLSMTEFFHQVSQRIRDPEEKAAYTVCYHRERLLADYAKGRKSVSFMGWYEGSEDCRQYLKMSLQLMQHPVTRDIIGIICTDDLTEQKRNEEAMACAMHSVFKLVLRIDARTGAFVICQRAQQMQLPAGLSQSFEAAAKQVLRASIPDDEEYGRRVQELQLWNIIRKLNATGNFVVYYNSLEAGSLHRKKLQFSYMDKENMQICMACTDVTGSAEK